MPLELVGVEREGGVNLPQVRGALNGLRLDPRAAQGSPGQAKAMAQMYTEFAKIGGLPYETQMDIKAEGGGAMGGLMSKFGGMQTTTTTESVETGALGDELFQVPADYKVKQQ